jgi:hypothetical protein
LIFNKNIDPSCSYCAWGRRISETEVACERCGIVSSGGDCTHFKYDPMVRKPSKPISLCTNKFKEEDFIV